MARRALLLTLFVVPFALLLPWDGEGRLGLAGSDGGSEAPSAVEDLAAVPSEDVARFVANYVTRPWGEEPILVRWETEATVEVRGSLGDAHRPLVAHAAAVFRGFGVPGMRLVETGGNFVVEVLSEEEFNALFPSRSESAGIGGILADRITGRITGARVFVKGDIGTLAQRRRLLLHEMGHGLGIGHPESFGPELIMASSWSAPDLTPIELAVMHAIYGSGRLRAGMGTTAIHAAIE